MTRRWRIHQQHKEEERCSSKPALVQPKSTVKTTGNGAVQSWGGTDMGQESKGVTVESIIVQHDRRGSKYSGKF
ncbi:hypothetical protein Pmani_038113 [Petrolisthes manimaculis]|uniref:Uncharacterized protein n=1 Tax=Petrolisthes manimaculis TaxID=1843537 RepID=A0AAE1NGV5_9EUCA|nr:hypothetical protein Pmani_038113 [Petrolisthes manimaculis]